MITNRVGHYYLIISMLTIFSGCGPNPFSGMQSKNLIKKSPEPHKYVGKKYTVMLDDVFRGIRNSLYDGQVLTVTEVDTSSASFPIILVADEYGKQIFTKKYAFGDLGLLNEDLRPIKTSIDPNKVINGKQGVIQHGYGYTFLDTKYHSFTSTVKKTKIDGVVAYGSAGSRLSGIGVQCTDNKEVALTWRDDDIIGAPSSKVSYSIYTEYNDVRKGTGYMFSNSYKSFSSLPSKEIIKDLLTGKRGALQVKVSSKVFTHMFFLDGFAEMYTRVKNNCH